MELKIISKEDDEIQLEIKGESHTLLNMLKSVLLDDERVEIATYDMKHVTISDPVILVKTDGTDPIIIVRDAASKLIAQCDEFLTVFNRSLK
ncbi:MAG: DNA-directed RNA polymerase subunit L [Methanosarcinaceae archaeon]|nr:DNA-directed RNA polymerase subunit L [Methanosarcinaceae archaeon]